MTMLVFLKKSLQKLFNLSFSISVALLTILLVSYVYTLVMVGVNAILTCPGMWNAGGLCGVQMSDDQSRH